MTPKSKPLFDPKIFLAKVGQGRTIAEYSKDHTIFSQSDPANAVFYIQKGKVKLTVVSNAGKEAVIAILDSGDFLGEGCLRAQPLCMATATAISDCSIVRLEKAAMIRVLHDEPAFSEIFVSYLLSRNMRIEEDLVDQLFNSSEKRLARVLLLLAHFGKEGKPEPGQVTEGARAASWPLTLPWKAKMKTKWGESKGKSAARRRPSKNTKKPPSWA
jgi:CRP-like cAMP-binding protein